MSSSPDANGVKGRDDNSGTTVRKANGDLCFTITGINSEPRNYYDAQDQLTGR
jgi:hypothetical protein